MAEGKRTWSSHKDCTHEDTKAARKKCRHHREHADCDHGSSPSELRVCTMRRKEVAKVSMGDLINALARDE